MFCKNIIKKPYIFQSLLYDHPQGSSSVLCALPLLRLLRYLPIRYVAICRLCVCAPGVPVCGLSGRERSKQAEKW
jgi:hypothetical protein